jgi:hypothetical protein
MVSQGGQDNDQKDDKHGWILRVAFGFIAVVIALPVGLIILWYLVSWFLSSVMRWS